MSYEKHTTLIVTCQDKKHLTKTRKKLIELFKLTFKDELDEINYCTQIITKIHKGLANSQYSFAVLPDGSKEGWSTSDAVENAINKLFQKETRIKEKIVPFMLSVRSIPKSFILE